MRICLFLLLAVFLFSCSSEQDRPARPDEPLHTLIFLDKSLSLNTNKTYATEKYQQALDEIVASNLRTTGDRITVYFIHENTAKARALSLTVRAEMEEVTNASPTDAEAAQMTFDLALQREKARFRSQLRRKLEQANEGLSNQRTDILASLPIIADAGTEGSAVKVYYLSDMVESMDNRAGGTTPQRDFHRTPPASDTQADDWAKADARQFRDLELGSPEVQLVLPFDPTATRRVNNPAITRYWQTLFSELGVDTVDEL